MLGRLQSLKVLCSLIFLFYILVAYKIFAINFYTHDEALHASFGVEMFNMEKNCKSRIHTILKEAINVKWHL